jgi:hypothetical protein
VIAGVVRKVLGTSMCAGGGCVGGDMLCCTLTHILGGPLCIVKIEVLAGVDGDENATSHGVYFVALEA